MLASCETRRSERMIHESGVKVPGREIRRMSEWALGWSKCLSWEMEFVGVSDN
jgi:hypothetical protein